MKQHDLHLIIHSTNFINEFQSFGGAIGLKLVCKSKTLWILEKQANIERMRAVPPKVKIC